MTQAKCARCGDTGETPYGDYCPRKCSAMKRLRAEIEGAR